MTWRGLLAFAVLILGCGASPNPGARSETKGQDSSNLRDPIRLEPFHVRARRDDQRLVVDAYDAGGLFERAAAHFRKGEYGEAVSLYEQIANEFPDSSFAPASLYNSGLCKEHTGRFEAAVDDYSRLVEEFPDSPDVTDALFRVVGAYEQLEAWEDVLSTIDVLLTQRDDLEGIERVESLARKGSALMHLDKPDQARLALEEASAIFRAGRGVSPSASTYYHAMSQFKLGEILQDEMHGAEIPADEDLAEPALERKCQLLLDAQSQYTRAIKVGHPHWAAAAAYRIGHLYRVLWDDMLATPPPDDLDEEQREIYLEVLKKRIRVLLKKAITQWERTLKMARRLELSGEWVERTENDLREIRGIMALEDETEEDPP